MARVKLLVRGCENKQKKHILKRKSDKRGQYRLGLFSAVVLLMLVAFGLE